MHCVPYEAGTTMVLLLLYNRVTSQSDGGLCQQSAVGRCAGVQRDRCLREYHTLEMRRRSDVHNTEDLPEDVLGECADGQDDPRSGRLGNSLRYLEDPDVVCGTLESDILGNGNGVRPLVEPRGERESANISRRQLSVIRRWSPRGIGVRGLHIAYSCGQVRWSWNRIVGCVHASSHLSRCRGCPAWGK